MISLEKYLENPCRTLPNPYWKETHFPKPEGLLLLHKDENHVPNGATPYFRLIQHLSPDMRYPVETPKGFELREAVLPAQAQLLATMICECYQYRYTAETVLSWTKYPVFDSASWLILWDAKSNTPAASAIADFDPTVGEAALEWIQVLPEYQGRGLGQAIVLELLERVKTRAKFVTVSGEVNNPTNPEKLYRKCGFVGDDI